MNRPTVLIVETQAKAALPVIESMARAGIRVAAASDERFNCGFYCRCSRERRLHPSSKDDPEAFKAWLLDLLRRRDIAMLFPMGHYGTAVISQIQDEIRKYTRLLLPPDPVFRAAYGKVGTMKAALAARVPIPDSWFPADLPGGLEEAIARIQRWPVLVKPDVGVGARGITWCHSADDVRRVFPAIERQHGESYIQDFVPPGGMQYKVDMLVDERQRNLAGIVYGKTRMYPPDGGSSILNYSAHRPDILDLAHRMLVQLRWVGFCDFDFVEDPRDRLVKIMEINPRFPESFRMGPSVGLDFPRMMFDLAHGRPVEPVRDYPKDRFLRFLVGDLMWFLRVENRRRFSTWPSWFHFSGRDTAYQICRWADPGPLIGYLLQNASMIFDRQARQYRLRSDSGPGGTR